MISVDCIQKGPWNKVREKGLTLIELMVALAISSIIMTGVVQLFVGSRQADQLTAGLARVQENARFAMDMLQEELRITAFQGCVESKPGLVTTKDLSIVANDFDFEDLWEDSIRGYTSDGLDLTIKSGQEVTDSLPGTDILSVAFAPPLSQNIIADISAPTDPVVIDGNNIAANAGSLMLIADCNAASVFRATEVTGGGPFTITHTTATNSSDSLGRTFKAADGAAFTPAATVHLLQNNTYFIRNNPADIPSLYRLSVTGAIEELIQGVENFQVRYGVLDPGFILWDPSDDRMNYMTAQEIEDSANWNFRDVRTLQLGMLIRDESNSLGTEGPETFEILGADITLDEADRRMRRIFTTTIRLRNRN